MLENLNRGFLESETWVFNFPARFRLRVFPATGRKLASIDDWHKRSVIVQRETLRQLFKLFMALHHHGLSGRIFWR